ncbi:hypothetical protein SRHO_G00171210 [Serrasalmus rhombeus]
MHQDDPEATAFSISTIGTLLSPITSLTSPPSHSAHHQITVRAVECQCRLAGGQKQHTAVCRSCCCGDLCGDFREEVWQTEQTMQPQLGEPNSLQSPERQSIILRTM